MLISIPVRIHSLMFMSLKSPSCCLDYFIFINIPNVSLFLLRHSSFFIILLLGVFVNVLYAYFENDVIFLTSFRSLSV